MRIRKQAAKMLTISQLPPPSSSVVNPPSSSEMFGFKQPVAIKRTEEKVEPMGKISTAEPQTCDEAEEAKKSSDVVVTCRRHDGKGWRCKRAAEDGNSFCDHHLSLIRARRAFQFDGTKFKKARKGQKKGKAEDEAGHGPAPVVVLDGSVAEITK